MNAGSGVDELGQGSGNNDGAGQLEENTGNYADAEKPEALNLAGQAETAVASRDDGTVACVIVAAKTDGFRRAGRAWSTKPRAIPQVHFTDEELAALCNDPHLIVSAGQVPADKVEHHV
ncbi:HI1506-related protein [Pseudoduganella sp. RAF53_2]|uniref:HI1506-related protein n=1 Tax=unclassified Pseudoduganella TaxID=2637179 RepID=UPI003F99749B